MSEARLIDIVQVAEGYKKLYDSTIYQYYQDEGMSLEYDFLAELDAILLDEYGWEIDNV